MYEVNKDSNFGDENEYLIIFQGRRFREWYDEDNVNAVAPMLAYIDINDNKIVTDSKFMMKALWNDNDDVEEKYKDKFQDGIVYHVKGRKCLGHRKYIPTNEVIYITEVLGTEEKCDELVEIYDEYMRPVIITNDLLGELLLDKEIYAFQGKTAYQDRDIFVTAFVNSAQQKTWNKRVELLAETAKNLPTYDVEAKKLLADKLLKLAKDYNDDVVIPKEDIIKRVYLEGVSIVSNNIEFDYCDDNIFGGHTIVVEGSLKAGLKKAYIAG